MKLRIILACLASIYLSGCSGTPENTTAVEPLNDAQATYERARNNIAAGNFSTAAQTLQAMSTRYPFGPLAHQVQLDLIYVYYKLADIDKALAAVDRFSRLNPNHQDIDYVLYMRGLINQRADYNAIQELAGIDRADRDPSKAKEAFNDFAQLLRRFPDSKYAADARQRMVGIKSRLAQYELSVAEYYMKREAYLAAANRGKYVLEYYSDTPEAEKALGIMANSYGRLNLTDLRDSALATLRQNFPDSSYLR
ncbi:membrane protein [Pseudidiomarina salinarum]|uniref:Outer membrane protein assembly factor BamD n=1 Tax=Pseudidiomarina salinarum TaxID=435908 RepID=A0A094ISR2_9GAMM|nr:outer membrane protein assembly factor BamD [Pseudidiomarina salinarum]KFZ30192.1 membrane protein [Pseudidiomarina salinarum]RUO68693.1 outer membrane protein assembly factor BamD [Pseudidiomarina salinarum]